MTNRASNRGPEPDVTAAAETVLASFWSLPFTIARMVHDFQLDSTHSLARAFWSHDRPHRHEPVPQLEIPEPIAEAPEQDLFA